MEPNVFIAIACSILLELAIICVPSFAVISIDSTRAGWCVTKAHANLDRNQSCCIIREGLLANESSHIASDCSISLALSDNACINA
jgi:predicted transposase YbfD/YdcC